MLRSSEIKPLFVDLSHCWQVIFFFLSIVPSGCVCEWTTNFFYHLSSCGVRMRMLVWLRMRTSSMVAYATIPQSFFMNLSCDECVFEWMLSLIRPHMSQWVRIWMTCGCVYGWLVGAYETIPQSFRMTLSCDECVFEWMLSLMRPHMSQWVRIWMTCGCV